MNQWRGFLLWVLVCVMFLPVEGSAANPRKKVYLILDADSYAVLQPELNQWKLDVAAEGRYTPEVFAFPSCRPEMLRYLLKQCHEQQMLAGVILAGNLPVFEFQDTLTPQEGPLELYFSNFNCEWRDYTGNGTADTLLDQTAKPDIWVSRLYPRTYQMGTNRPPQLLRSYFQKNHAYRTGTLQLPQSALYFINLANGWESEPEQTVALYPQETVIIHQQATAPEYLSRLRSRTGQEMVHISCHSYPNLHLLPEGNVSPEEIRAVNPKAFFFMLDTCETGNFLAKNYLAGAYLFDTTYGLFAMAASLSTGSSFPERFSVFSAYAGQDWGSIMMHLSKTMWRPEYCLMGDPTLIPHISTPKFMIQPPPEITPATPLRLPRPSTGSAQTWKIPLCGRLTAGMGSELSLMASGLPAGMTVLPSGWFMTKKNAENRGEIAVRISPDTPLGQRLLTVTAEDWRGQQSTCSYWIEIVSAAPAASAGIEITKTGPDWGDETEQTTYYGVQTTLNLTLQCRLTQPSTVPLLVNIEAVDWPSGFTMDTTFRGDADSARGCKLIQTQSDMLPLAIVSPQVQPGSYVLPVRVKANGFDQTFDLRLRVEYPMAMATENSELLSGKALTGPPPIQFDTHFMEIEARGRPDFTFHMVNPAGIQFTLDRPLQIGPQNLFSVSAPWNTTPGHYPLINYSLPGFPEVPERELVWMDVLSQYGMTIEPATGTWSAGTLKLSIKNLSRDNPPYELDLTATATKGVQVSLPSPVTITTYNSPFPLEVKMAYQVPVTLLPPAGQTRDITLTVQAKSPVYNWPPQTCSYVFRIEASRPGVPLRHTLKILQITPSPAWTAAGAI